MICFQTNNQNWQKFIPKKVTWDYYYNKSMPKPYTERRPILQLFSPNVIASVDLETFKAAINLAFPNSEPEKTTIHFMPSRKSGMKIAYIKLFGREFDSYLGQKEPINCSLFAWEGPPPFIPRQNPAPASTLMNFNDPVNNNFKMYKPKSEQNWKYDNLPGVSVDIRNFPDLTKSSPPTKNSGRRGGIPSQAPLAQSKSSRAEALNNNQQAPLARSDSSRAEASNNKQQAPLAQSESSRVSSPKNTGVRADNRPSRTTSFGSANEALNQSNFLIDEDEDLNTAVIHENLETARSSNSLSKNNQDAIWNPFGRTGLF